MYDLKVTKQTLKNLWSAFEKYLKNYDDESKIKKHFGIEPKQFFNLRQQIDTGNNYSSFDEMYKHSRKDVKLSKSKYKNTVLLLLSYQKNIITF